MIAESEQSVLITHLLEKAGLSIPPLAVYPLARGGNNKIWRVETVDACYVAKQYFRHPGDTRDRLTAEFEFLRYATELIPGQIPYPVACDTASGMGLYSYMSGVPFSAGQIGESDVETAAVFFAALNPSDRNKRASHLPIASEACFSVAEHLGRITQRIEALQAVLFNDKVLPDAGSFMKQLQKGWFHLEQNILSTARQLGLDIDSPLPYQQRCLSPSDFGFHNALRQTSGNICFLDFEYAGWDDPAKTVGDFFSQLAIPVSEQYFEPFLNQALAGFPDVELLTQRACLLRPAYQIKWCCIALNVFLPVNLARRRFAHPNLDEKALKQIQLRKAIQLFDSIQTTHQ